MQGRLLPKYKNKYQAFPLTKWRSEFSKIKKYNLDCIELIFDEINNIKKNPLYNFKGLEEIKLIKKKRKVKIFSVCADYFIKNPLYLKSKKNLNILKKLIKNCNYLGIKYIILPFVDQSSLNTCKKKQKALNNLKFLLKDLKKIN